MTPRRWRNYFPTSRYASGGELFDVRLSPSRGQFLIPTPVEQTGRVPITVAVNWTAVLKK